MAARRSRRAVKNPHDFRHVRQRVDGDELTYVLRRPGLDRIGGIRAPDRRSYASALSTDNIGFH